MRVLMAAAACSPYLVSEHSVGWVWLKAAAAHHEVHLLCADYDVGDLARAREEGLLPDHVQVTAVGQPVWPYSKDRFTARLQTWKRAAQFQAACARRMREVLAGKTFDLAHHTSIATWRLGSPLADTGLPLVWGPLGGGEPFPLRYLSVLTPKAKYLEIGRILSNAKDRFRPSVRRTARRAAVGISTNLDTDNILRSLGARCPILRCPMLLEDSKFETIDRLAAGRVRNPGKLRIFSGGTLEGRKGIHMSLHALVKLREAGIPFHYTFGNHGPDGPAYAKMSRDLGLQDHVTFLPALKGPEYFQQLIDTDVFLLPSLRDNTSLTLIEAMAARCLPVVLQAGGPGDAVTKECGFALPLSNPRRTASEIFEVLNKAWENPAQAEGLANASRERVRNTYLSSRIPKVLKEAYALAKAA
jgi:glycosyltransferase involved in cell wall biosynthesis